MTSQFSYAKKLSFFISSKADELEDERKAVISAIRSMRLNPVFFEGFGARLGKPLAECLKEVESSDFYIGILGNQYSSATATEYRKAEEKGKPCLIYIKAVDEFRRDDKLKVLVENIKTSHFYSTFRTSEELGARVKEDIAIAITELIEKGRQERTWENNMASRRLREWRFLQEKLRDLEITFSPCYEEVVRLRRDGKTPFSLNVYVVVQAWEVCKKGPLSQLMELARGIEYIDEKLWVEKWIGDLVEGQQKIDSSIRRANSGDLYESISSFNQAIISIRNALDAQISRAILINY
jgi:hypothetical protein